MDLSERDSILKEITNLENRIEDLRQQQSDTENSLVNRCGKSAATSSLDCYHPAFIPRPEITL